MELSEIKILVTKYFDGETTLLEEQALYDYLQSRKDLDDEMMAAKVMLSAFAQNRQIKAPDEVPVPKVGRNRVLGCFCSCFKRPCLCRDDGLHSVRCKKRCRQRPGVYLLC